MNREFSLWTIGNVYSYLRLNDISHESADLLRKAEVDGAIIKEITQEELEHLNIPFGPRKKIFRIFQELKSIFGIQELKSIYLFFNFFSRNLIWKRNNISINYC